MPQALSSCPLALPLKISTSGGPTSPPRNERLAAAGPPVTFKSHLLSCSSHAHTPDVVIIDHRSASETSHPHRHPHTHPPTNTHIYPQTQPPAFSVQLFYPLSQTSPTLTALPIPGQLPQTPQSAPCPRRPLQPGPRPPSSPPAQGPEGCPSPLSPPLPISSLADIPA